MSPRKLTRLPILAFIATPVFAQTAPPANPAVPGKPADDQALVLSPFVVGPEQDNGYQAAASLAGTRTRTALRDLASPVSVFTADLIEDLGATSEADIMRYSASAVPELGEQGASVNGNIIGQPVFKFRIRGQAATRARNYFPTLAPPDTYNLDRFEESRGPNAILFGTGGAGGILNQSTKRANPARARTMLVGTVGRHDLLRGEIDHNQVLLKDQLALRFNGMLQDANDWHPHQFSHEQRGTLAATWRASAVVTVHAEVEAGKIHDAVSRDFGPLDYFSQWLERGRPVTATRVANAASAIALGANQQRVTVVGNDGSIRNFQQMPQSTTDPARRGGALLDPALVPWRASLQGPGSERFIEFQSATAQMAMSPARGLHLELAADYQSMSYRRFDPLSGVLQVFGDASANYRDNTPNPHAGRLYIDAQWRKVRQEEDLRTLRATAAYALGLGRGGRHQFGAMAQATRNRYCSDSLYPVLLGAPFNPSPYNARNQVYTRTYFQPGAPAGEIAATSWRSIPAQVGVVMDAGAPPVTLASGWVTNGTSINDDWMDHRTLLSSVQSHFLGEQLVTLLGVRRDERLLYNRPLQADAAGLYRVDYSRASRTKVAANQGSLGVVWHLRPWISLLHNRSQNAGEPGTRTELIPDGALQPVSRGRGQDTGVSLSLLEGRLQVRLARFETTMIDDSKSFVANANTIDRHHRILDTMVTDRILTPAEADALRYRGGSNVDLLDRRTTGWELSATANPAPAWRLLVNAAQGRSVETNLLKRTRALAPALLAVWQRARPASVTSNSIPVSQELADFNTWLATNTAVEGRSSLGDREWQLKAFARHEVTSGPLKGAFLGAGLLYQSAPVIGAGAAAGALFRGESTTEADALAGYSTRAPWLAANTRLTLQINASDLLQRRAYYSLRRDTNGLLATVRVAEPAQWRLQARLQF